MNALVRRNGGIGNLLSPRDTLDGFFGEYGFPIFRFEGFDNPITEETENEYCCEFDMPGLEKDDIKVDIEENTLLINGYRKSGNRERSYSEAINLGDRIVGDDIKVAYKNGVLSLRIPKKKEEKKISKRINIE